ncbi:MAG: hypothetical protein LBE91_00305 [Tannerella sp.]|jgi:hypothetical protein|nr:hypothetical protein [Tannerella sp.]
MNKKKILSVIGVVALLMGVGMNVEHAVNDYGMHGNGLMKFVLAQDSTTKSSVIGLNNIIWPTSLAVNKNNRAIANQFDFIKTV